MQDRCEDVPCGLLECSESGEILYANRTLATWLGETPEALVGRKFESILTVANRVFHHTHFLPLLQLHGKAEEIFLTLLGKNDERVPVVSSAMRDVTETTVRLRCAFIAVPQRRKYEDEILQAKKTAEEALQSNEQLRTANLEAGHRARELEQKLRDIHARNDDLQRVSQILSHDLREPIRKISLFADLARSHVSALPDPEALETVQKIEAEAAQMDKLIAAMRQFLQVESPAAPEKLDLNEVVEKAIESVALKTSFSDWLIERDSLPSIEGRRPQLHLLFSHLLENAIKFRDPNRRLRIKISSRIIQENIFKATADRYCYVDFARIEIQDNGKGFDPKYNDYVFRLLKKVDLRSPGLGVGLAICRKVVEAHYGSIAVNAKRDAGVTFVILLPIVQ